MLLQAASLLLLASTVTCKLTVRDIYNEQDINQYHEGDRVGPRDADHKLAGMNTIRFGEVGNTWNKKTRTHHASVTSELSGPKTEKHETMEYLTKRADVPDITANHHATATSIDRATPTADILSSDLRDREVVIEHQSDHKTGTLHKSATRLVHTRVTSLAGLPTKHHSSSSTRVPIRSTPGTPSKDAYTVKNSAAPVIEKADRDGKDEITKRAPKTEVFEYVYGSSTSLATARGTFASGVGVYPSMHSKTRNGKGNEFSAGKKTTKTAGKE